MSLQARLSISILFWSILSPWAVGQSTLSIPSRTVSPDAAVDIPVNLSQGGGVAGVQLTLAYDPGFLRIRDTDSDGDLNEELLVGSLIPAGSFVVVNTSESGAISVAIVSSSSFATGSGSVVIVPFQVVASTGSTTLSVENPVLSDTVGNPVAVATVDGTLTVQGSSGGNQAPSAVSDSAATAEDTPVAISVLSNDSDPEAGLLTIDSVTQPANGSVSIQGTSTVRYSPDLNFNGTDVFSYSISDPEGAVDSATVTIEVTPVNDAPVAGNDSATTPLGEAVVLDVLGNDRDVDGDALNVTISSPPANGSVVVNPGQTIAYTPSGGFTGTDLFTYLVADGNGGSDTGEVSITVSGTAAEDALLIFPQFVDGGDSGDSPVSNSSRIILRNESDREALVRVRFRNQQGRLQSIPVVGEPLNSSQYQRSINARGLVEIETVGSGPLKSGVVEVLVEGGDAGKIQGTLIYSLFGTFVSIDRSPVRTEQVVPVSVNTDVVLGENTGLAAYNPDPDRAATVEIVLLDRRGTPASGPRHIEIGPRSQLIGFVTEEEYFSEYFDSNHDPFLGSMRLDVTEGPALAVIGLIQKRESFNSALISLPVSGGDSGERELVFPQFFDGGGRDDLQKANSSRLMISNNSDQLHSVDIEFWDGAGSPIPVPIQGADSATVNLDIPSQGVSQVETDGGGSLKFGVVKVGAQADALLSGNLVFALFDTFVSVGSSSLRSEHRLLVSVRPDAVLGENTGIAVYNPSRSAAATLVLHLLDSNGQSIQQTRNLTLEPGQQLLGFVTEDAYFKSFFESVSAPFLGTLYISVLEGPEVSVLSLIQKKPSLNSALIAVSSSGGAVSE